MRHVLRLGSVLALMSVLFVAGVGPASAYTIISESGPHGSVWLNDSNSDPGAKCGFGKLIANNYAWFKFMKVQPPVVYAADRNSYRRDHRRVSWAFKIQTVPFAGGRWHAVASSNVQRATAYEDQKAPFSAMKVYWKPSRTGPGALKIRALVIVKWYKPSGAVESVVKLAPDWYYSGSPFNSVGGQPYCQDKETLG